MLYQFRYQNINNYNQNLRITTNRPKLCIKLIN